LAPGACPDLPIFSKGSEELSVSRELEFMSGQPSATFHLELHNESELIANCCRRDYFPAVTVVADLVRGNPYVRFPGVFFSWQGLSAPIALELVWHFA
jgi:hypothetical protein